MKRSIIVFHSSPDRIENFQFERNKNIVGVHFGGIYSSLEAATRKFENDDQYNSDLNIYIHKCILTYCSNEKTEVDDLGSTIDWEDFAIEMQDNNLSVAEYKNLYEPDIVSSWYILNSKHIELVETSVMSLKSANKELDAYYLSEGIVL